ncbi:Cytochrome protein, partial [Ophiophagus hannah]
MKHLPGLHQTALSSVEMVLSFVKKEIEQHKENQSQHEPQDFIDFYLLQMEKRKDDPNSTYDEDNLAQCVVDFFIAGTETTLGSLKWTLLFLASHLDIQDKVYKEMEEVFSPSHSICYEDRKNLPYTNAVIHEIMRNKYPLFFGFPRQSVQDISLNGFLFPKGAIILPDLRSVLFDPEHWETPEEFNPNHFLDKEGNFVIKEAFLPFGAGARVCLGELLAKIELFNIFTRLLREFRVEPPEGVELSEKSIMGAIFDKHEDLPPGPSPISLILAKQYGNIYSLWRGNHYIIVLSGYRTVKEALTKHGETFNDRPLTPFLSTISKKNGIAFSNGHTWLQQRRLTIVTMRKLGLGKKSVESQIQAEVERFLEDIGSKKGQPFDPSMYIIQFAGNVICAIVFGHRFSTEDKEFLELIESMDIIAKFLTTFSHVIYEIFPFIMKYLPGPQQKALSAVENIIAIIKKEIAYHKDKDDPNSPYDEDNMAHCIGDIFIGGTDTTSSALQWAFLLMAIHLDIQDKVYKEIEKVLNPSHSICYKDRKNLPYTNAVIHEILRSKYVTFFGLPRKCGAMIISDLRSVLLDPEQWETPEKFNPNHFLDKEGHFVTKEAFMPFGAGNRICVGEIFARIEFFILFTSLLRAFRLQPPEGVEKFSEESVKGAILHPFPFQICAVPRSRTP